MIPPSAALLSPSHRSGGAALGPYLTRRWSAVGVTQYDKETERMKRLIVCVVLMMAASCVHETTGEVGQAEACTNCGDGDDDGGGGGTGINEQTAPDLVYAEAVLYAQADDLSCGWDRCGNSGGYVCRDYRTGVIVVWQRGTQYLQIGWNGCVVGGNSCYRCPGNTDF